LTTLKNTPLELVLSGKKKEGTLGIVIYLKKLKDTAENSGRLVY